MTSKHSYGPSEDWLKITKTTQAKNKIKQFFKRQRKEENVQRGRELVEKEIKNMDLQPKEVLTEENIQLALDRFHFQHENDLYAAVGYQGVTALQVTNRITEKFVKKKKKSIWNRRLKIFKMKSLHKNGKPLHLVSLCADSIICLSVYRNVATLFQGMKLSAILQRKRSLRAPCRLSKHFQ